MIIIKNVSYKLVNILLIIFSIFLISRSIDLYKNVFLSIVDIILPIVLSFFISYSLYPCVKVFNKKLSYNFSCFLVIVLGIIILFLIIWFSVPIFVKEFYLIRDDIINFLSRISFMTNDMFMYFKSLFTFSNSLVILNKSASFFTNLIIVVVLSIYFLFNMNNIKQYLSKYDLFCFIDKDLYNYYKSFYLLILIETLEYLILYFLIGHPYFLLIAILSGITTVIPFFGALFTNFLALISSFSISTNLFILTAIVMIVIPIFNNYVIEPHVYNKTLKVSLVSVIISCFIFGSLFGLIGIVFAIPLFIIIKNLLIFFFPRFKRM